MISIQHLVGKFPFSMYIHRKNREVKVVEESDYLVA